MFAIWPLLLLFQNTEITRNSQGDDEANYCVALNNFVLVFPFVLLILCEPLYEVTLRLVTFQF